MRNNTSTALEKFKNRQQLIEVAKKKADYALTKDYPSLSQPIRSKIVYITRQFLYPYQTADGKIILRIQRKPLALHRIKSYLSEHTSLNEKKIGNIANKMMSPANYINLELPEKRKKKLTASEKEKTAEKFYVRTPKKVREETEKQRKKSRAEQPTTIAKTSTKEETGFLSEYWPYLVGIGGVIAIYIASR